MVTSPCFLNLRLAYLFLALLIYRVCIMTIKVAANAIIQVESHHQNTA